MFFPLPYMWKMAKDAPNHVLMNMIGLAKTSREILEDCDAPIFPVVLSTQDLLQLSLHHHCDRAGIPLFAFCVEVNKICI